MGGTYAIYSSPATGIGLKVPHAQHKVCHQGGRPGDGKARYPQRTHKMSLGSLTVPKQ